MISDTFTSWQQRCLFSHVPHTYTVIAVVLYTYMYNNNVKMHAHTLASMIYMHITQYIVIFES